MIACLQLTEYFFLARWMLFMLLTTIWIQQGLKWLLKNTVAGYRKSLERLDSSNKYNLLGKNGSLSFFAIEHIESLHMNHM